MCSMRAKLMREYDALVAGPDKRTKKLERSMAEAKIRTRYLKVKSQLTEVDPIFQTKKGPG